MRRGELARLFLSEAPKLMRRLSSFHGRVAAEDVVQTAFAKMLEVDADEIADPKAYLAQLTRNLAIDEVRRQERAPVRFVTADAFEAKAATELTPEQMLIEGERYAHMMGAVLALPEKERLALLLFKLKGLSHKEIAGRLGVSPKSVPRYLSRALEKCDAARHAFERAGTGGIADDGRKGKADQT
jgi:RNA polymerase sigma-70 factor (ECF subfamily)